MANKFMRILLVAALLIVWGSAANAANGILKITSFPTGAEIHVDGVDTGKLTPGSVNLAEGEHEVMVQIPDPAWAPDTRLVTIAPGNNDLSVTLLPNLADVWEAITDLQTLVLAQQGQIDGLGSQLIVSNGRIASLEGDLEVANGTIAVLQSDLLIAEADISNLASSPIFALEPYVSLNLSTVEGVVGPHVIFEGVNLHVRNLGGSTDSVDGLGNLIVGYNADVGWNRTGSHNMVIGNNHGYSRFGGLVAGDLNTISAPGASVTGGQWNHASGPQATICGGGNNTSTAYASTVCGGALNVASAQDATVTGGFGNKATGFRATVSGGYARIAAGENDWIAGSLFEDN